MKGKSTNYDDKKIKKCDFCKKKKKKKKIFFLKKKKNFYFLKKKKKKKKKFNIDDIDVNKILISKKEP